MKKKVYRLFGRAVVCASVFVLQPSIHAQISHPSTWDDFVHGKTNPVVTDTFRMQTFGQSPSDNWSYTSKGDVITVETSRMQISGKCGEYGLSIPMEAEVSFQHYPIDQYENVAINVHAGGQNRKKGDSLMVRTYRPGDPEYIKIVGCAADNEKKPYSLCVRISKNPQQIDLVTFKPRTYSADSRYCLDSIYALGQIPAYSLFSGTGNWNDTARWTHLPAARYRSALVNGEVSVSSSIHCANLLIGNGNLRILPQGYLSVKNLSLYPDESSFSTPITPSLISSGTIDIQGSIAIEKVFARKGSWYFISFPVDVYPDGIDPGFQLGDDQSNTNGNYFYIKTYNGEKRSTQQSATGNWETVPQSAMTSGQPLFQKGKGYLIALDAAADRQTICLTSRPHSTPTDFGKNGTSLISVAINRLSENQNHNGWYLCGNPLPSALPLNRIVSNGCLDGFIYLYDGSVYRSYAIGSDYTVPPFSAFFVKATENTELSIRDAGLPSNVRALDAPPPLLSGLAEPADLQISTLPVESTLATCYIAGETLFLENIDSAGDLWIFNKSGKLLFQASVPSGHSTIQLSLPKGIYILRLETKKERINQKFILS